MDAGRLSDRDSDSDAEESAATAAGAPARESSKLRAPPSRLGGMLKRSLSRAPGAAAGEPPPPPAVDAGRLSDRDSDSDDGAGGGKRGVTFGDDTFDGNGNGSPAAGGGGKKRLADFSAIVAEATTKSLRGGIMTHQQQQR